MHICTLSICFYFFIHTCSSVTNRNHSRNATGESVFLCAKNPGNLFVMKYSNSRDAMTTKEKSAHKIGNILS